MSGNPAGHARLFLSNRQSAKPAMDTRNNLQDLFLNTLRRERMPVAVFLVNGIKLTGRIDSFDQFVIHLKGHDQAGQMVFKHAISTISPSREVGVTPSPEA